MSRSTPKASPPPRDTRRHPLKRLLLLLDWYSRAYHAGVAKYAGEAGWILDAMGAHGRPDDFVSGWRGDGILCMIHEPRTTGAFCRSASVPAVDLAWQCPDIPLPRVLHDNAAHGRLAAEHLLDRGFRNFAFYGDSPWLWSDEERFQGFQTCLMERGYQAVRLQPKPLSPPHASGRLQLDKLSEALRGMPKPLGVMAHNDDCGIQVIDACLRGGILVPEQVAVVGCDNDVLICDFAPVPLTSVDPGLEIQAYEAARLLGKLMQGHPPPEHPIRIAPHGIVARQSSDILAVKHPEVAKAIRFIWERSHDPVLGVDDVVAATALSKTGLNKAFQSFLGRPVGEELRRFRLERAKMLLRNSPAMSITDIAVACGYGSDKHFRDSLLRYEGCTPSDWRGFVGPAETSDRKRPSQ